MSVLTASEKTFYSGLDYTGANMFGFKKSIDGGYTWENIPDIGIKLRTSQHGLTDAYADDEILIFLINSFDYKTKKRSSIILRSFDQGLTWNKQENKNIIFDKILHHNKSLKYSKTIFVVTAGINKFHVYKSKDWIHWEKIPVPNNSIIIELYADKNNNIYILTDESAQNSPNYRINFSKNNGATWEILANSEEFKCYRSSYFSVIGNKAYCDAKYLIFDNDQSIFKNMDFNNEKLVKISYLENKIIAATLSDNQYNFYVSKDGGESFSKLNYSKSSQFKCGNANCNRQINEILYINDNEIILDEKIVHPYERSPMKNYYGIEHYTILNNNLRLLHSFSFEQSECLRDSLKIIAKTANGYIFTDNQFFYITQGFEGKDFTKKSNYYINSEYKYGDKICTGSNNFIKDSKFVDANNLVILNIDNNRRDKTGLFSVNIY